MSLPCCRLFQWSWTWDSRGVILLVNTEAKKVIEYSRPFHVHCHQGPVPIQQRAHIFSCFLSMLTHLQKPFWLPFMLLISFNSRWALAFQTPSLQAWTVSLFSSWVTCLCFHILHAFPLWLNLVRSYKAGELLEKKHSPNVKCCLRKSHYSSASVKGFLSSSH